MKIKEIKERLEKIDFKQTIIFLLVVLAYLLWEDRLMEMFDGEIFPILSNVKFSIWTHLFFVIICLIICKCIYDLYKRKYYIPCVNICYIILGIVVYAEHRIFGPYISTPNLLWEIGYSDVLIMLLGIYTIILLSHLKRKNGGTEANNDFIPDIPIENDKDDILGYTPTAIDYAQKIKNIDTQHSCSIGVIGSWGLGKTSFLNLLYNQFDKNLFIVIRFNPRHSRSASDIQKDFFNLLYSTLGRYDSRFNSTFKNYLKTLGIC